MTRHMSSPRHCHADCRRAFTLVELLTTIAVIGLLIALVLPAVQMSREAARRLQCSGQLRQIGLALDSYASSFGSFPNAGNGRGYSAHCMLLPFLDERSLFNAINLSQSSAAVAPGSANYTVAAIKLSAFLCPSDYSSASEHAVGWSNYAGNQGVNRRAGNTQNGAFTLPFLSSWTTLASFTDGLSTTAAMSEWVVGPVGLLARDAKGDVFETPTLLIGEGEFTLFAAACHGLDPLTAKIDVPDKGIYWHQGGYLHTNYNHVLGPNDHSCMTGGGWVQWGAFPASSRHPGTVNVLYADGHVIASSEHVNIELWRAIGTRNGGEVVDERGL
jgi:prepilin-type processing-associated H-X9-DG protein/prepilin-type N-terminal cleavage/methylation domain-containing protein